MLGTTQGQRRDSAGTRQGQTVTNRDKQGHSLSIPACPCLSLSVPVCPWFSLLVLFCPCLSLSVPVFPCMSLHLLYLHVYPLQMNITIFISMNIFTLTFLSKTTVPMLAHLVFNFFYTFNLACSITISFNPNSSILVINITKGFTWFLSSLVFFSVNYCTKWLSFTIFLMIFKG